MRAERGGIHMSVTTENISLLSISLLSTNLFEHDLLL
jgi:hypothetical protein